MSLDQTEIYQHVVLLSALTPPHAENRWIKLLSVPRSYSEPNLAALVCFTFVLLLSIQNRGKGLNSVRVTVIKRSYTL